MEFRENNFESGHEIRFLDLTFVKALNSIVNKAAYSNNYFTNTAGNINIENLSSYKPYQLEPVKTIEIEPYAIRCFVDQDGNIFSINHDGTSAFPADIEIKGDTVYILGDKDDIGHGREIAEEFTLWPSLTALAKALEPELN
jgi:hypothetical protein